MGTGPAAVVSKHFENITDPRVDRGKNHSLIEMIFLALTATICGAQRWADVERFAKSKLKWFRRHARLKYGVPSHDTFGRVLGDGRDVIILTDADGNEVHRISYGSALAGQFVVAE